MKTFKDTVVATAKAMVDSDSNSKVLFNDTIALLKGAKVTDVKSSINGLVDDAKEALADKYSGNFVNRIVKVIKLGGSWYNKKLFTNHEELFMYNIEGGLKLLDALETLATTEGSNVTDKDVKSTKNSLNRVKFVDKVQYNNDFEAKVKEMMKKFNLADVDGAIVSLENRLTKLWGSMDTQQQTNFLAFISKNCKVTKDTKVAEDTKAS